MLIPSLTPIVLNLNCTWRWITCICVYVCTYMHVCRDCKYGYSYDNAFLGLIACMYVSSGACIRLVRQAACLPSLRRTDPKGAYYKDYLQTIPSKYQPMYVCMNVCMDAEWITDFCHYLWIMDGRRSEPSCIKHGLWGSLAWWFSNCSRIFV